MCFSKSKITRLRDCTCSRRTCLKHKGRNLPTVYSIIPTAHLRIPSTSTGTVHQSHFTHQYHLITNYARYEHSEKYIVGCLTYPVPISTLRNLTATTLAVLLLSGTTMATANVDTDAKLDPRSLSLQECLHPFYTNDRKPNIKNISDCVG